MKGFLYWCVCGYAVSQCSFYEVCVMVGLGVHMHFVYTQLLCLRIYNV